MVREAAQEWVHDKFLHPVKISGREAFWPGLSWRYALVHAVVKDPAELEEFRREGIRLIYLKRVLEDLCPPERLPFTASAGADLADLIDFYGRTSELPEEESTEEDEEEAEP